MTRLLSINPVGISILVALIVGYVVVGSATVRAETVLVDSGPITVSRDGQIVENLRITSTNGFTYTTAAKRSLGQFPQRGGYHHKTKDNPMQLPIHQAKLCLAKTRRQSLCQSPAMVNGKCRMHGGMSPGAPTGERNGNYRHGLYTKENLAMKDNLRNLLRTCQETVQEIP